MNPLTALISPIVGAFSSAYVSNQDRKKSAETAKYKIRQAKEDATNTLNLTDSEWESVTASKQDSSWKDEYVTVIVTLPIPLLFLGSIIMAYSPESSQLLEGTVEGIKAINTLEGSLSDMMLAVVYGAIGLKVWRGR